MQPAQKKNEIWKKCQTAGCVLNVVGVTYLIYVPNHFSPISAMGALQSISLVNGI